MANEYELWYMSKGMQQMKDLQINLNDAKDVERLRIPPLTSGGASRPLFENGFKNTKEDQEKLYEAVKNGQLFAFQKGTDKPYQVTEKGNFSCEDPEMKAPSAFQKSAYFVGSAVWPFARFGIRLLTRVANIATFGFYSKDIKAIEGEIDKYAGKASEFLFNSSAQRRQDANTVGFTQRAINFVSRGYFFNDQIQNEKREKKYLEQRGFMGNSLEREKKDWERKTQEEKRKAEEAKKQSKVDKQLQNTRDKINNLNQPTPQRTQTNTFTKENNPVQQGTTQGNNNDQAPADSGKEMKTKLQMQYEEMRMAFGPGGGGFDEAAKIAQNMNVMIKELQDNPAKLEASGIDKDKLKEFSNMCTTMADIRKEGLQATAALMDKDVCNGLSAQQKQENICKVQLMHMVEGAMVNSAFSSYLDHRKQPGKEFSEMKNSRIFNQMKGDPETFKKNWYKGIKMMDSTAAYMRMDANELAEFMAEPGNIRDAQTADIHKGAREIKEQQRQQETLEKQASLEQQKQQQQQKQQDLATQQLGRAM